LRVVVLLLPVLMVSVPMGAQAAGSDHVPFIAVPPPAVDTGAPTIAVPGGPGQLDVTKPYYYNPPPQSLSNTDQLQLKAYRDQLYWQQRELELQQSQKVLTPNQQQRLYQTQQESNRVNQLLTPAPTPTFTLPPVSTTVLPPSIIPTH
jgi:hypothetical protein